MLRTELVVGDRAIGWPLTSGSHGSRHAVFAVALEPLVFDVRVDRAGFAWSTPRADVSGELIEEFLAARRQGRNRFTLGVIRQAARQRWEPEAEILLIRRTPASNLPE